MQSKHVMKPYAGLATMKQLGQATMLVANVSSCLVSKGKHAHAPNVQTPPRQQ